MPAHLRKQTEQIKSARRYSHANYTDSSLDDRHSKKSSSLLKDLSLISSHDGYTEHMWASHRWRSEKSRASIQHQSLTERVERKRVASSSLAYVKLHEITDDLWAQSKDKTLITSQFSFDTTVLHLKLNMLHLSLHINLILSLLPLVLCHGNTAKRFSLRQILIHNWFDGTFVSCRHLNQKIHWKEKNAAQTERKCVILTKKYIFFWYFIYSFILNYMLVYFVHLY